ncbi:hypothetical protein E2562_035782 [Oryza meyeriana var. granulata]|uniref:KIB1-4 beta-propeller domain-containing protein n=1 Tax=Oryza meyeriana var. granulata TaxID=110450 RepID=A0A6G1CLA2_9ORYZ|nr:hypothetical protein E2562_035782 [Oryza meyeriana var. granulata]
MRAPLGMAGAGFSDLQPELMAKIHDRLSFLDRLAFSAVSAPSRYAFKPEPPWLVLPGDVPQVKVFDEKRTRWEAAKDVGDLAVLVGVNSSLCVSTTKHPELKAGCVYYTDDEIGKASLRRQGADGPHRLRGHDADSKRNVGVYSLRDGTVESIPELGDHLSWPPPAWFTLSFP